MNSKKFFGALFVIAILLIVPIAVTGITSGSPIHSGVTDHDNILRTSTQKYKFMPWVCQFCGSEKNYTSFIERYHDLFTALSYEQYYLAPNDTFQSLGVPDLVNISNMYHLPAYPMIVSNNPKYMHVLFTNATIQKSFIRSAVMTAMANGFAGYNIDFEVPYFSDSANVTNFVENFSNALLAAGKQLTLDVPGFARGFSPSAHGSAYNYSALSNTSVSLIVVMDYFSIGDFETAVNYSVSHISMNKLMIALPDYSYAFYVNTTSNQPFPYNLIPPYVNSSYSGMYGALRGILKSAREDHANITKHFGTFYGEPYYEIVYPGQPGVGNEFYYINKQAMDLRINYLESMGITHIALWRAGAVDPSIISVLHQFKEHVERESAFLGLPNMFIDVAKTSKIWFY